MVFITVLGDYIRWHYSRAFSDIFSIWRNITYFVFHFFSIPLLFRTYFSTWKRIEAIRETKGLDVKDFVATKLVNTMMRLVGMTMRTTLILTGFAVIGVVVVGGVIFFMLWAIMPLIILIFIGAGIQLITIG